MRKSRGFALSLFAFAIPLTLPVLFFTGIVILRDKAFIYTMLPCLCALPLLCFIPQGKKARKAMLPKRIYTDKDHIVSIADRYTDSRFISDVTKVIDHGEFYELCFPFGKSSEKFICQKSLLTRGTFKEFERMFNGKIVRKIKNDRGQGDGSPGSS